MMMQISTRSTLLKPLSPLFRGAEPQKPEAAAELPEVSLSGPQKDVATLSADPQFRTASDLNPPKSTKVISYEPELKDRMPVSFKYVPPAWRGLFVGTFDQARRIDPDLDEFMDILDGKTKEDGKHLLDNLANKQYKLGEDGSIIVNKPEIKIPNIHHGNNGGKGQGVGSGDGEPGGEPQDGEGKGKAGEGAGNNQLAPWQHRYSPSDIAQAIMNQKYGLPFLRPSEGDTTKVQDVKEGVKPVPPGGVHRKITFHKAIRRSIGADIAKGNAPDFNNIVVTRPDKMYEAMETQPLPFVKVAVIQIADVSGSITENARNLTRHLNRITSYPIKYQYGKMAADLNGEEYTDEQYFGKDGTDNEDGGPKFRHIIYTDGAKEVSEKEFYETKESGGTRTSSAFLKAIEIIEKDYPPSAGWNVYINHFSDGDTFGGDASKCKDLIQKMLNMGVRQIANCGFDTNYSEYKNSDYGRMLDVYFDDDKRVPNIGVKAEKAAHGWSDFLPVIKAFLPGETEEGTDVVY